MPPQQSKRGEPLTFGDRVVTALIGGICGFGTMLVVWFIVMYVGGRRGADITLPFYWTWTVGLAVATLAFLAGPEPTLDAFEQVWGLLGKLLFWRSDHTDLSSRRGKRR